VTKRPNIVVIMADQLAPQFTGTSGHPIVQTPNLDALAARGMRFDAAYCNSPLWLPHGLRSWLASSSPRSARMTTLRSSLPRFPRSPAQPAGAELSA